LIPDDDQDPRDLMATLRSHKAGIIEAFHDYLDEYYQGITERKVSFLFISFTVKTTVNEDISEFKGTFGDDKVLPRLPAEDKKALSELLSFLERFPVNPENISAEFMPYAIAFGQNDYWMGVFGADDKQRDLIPEPDFPGFPGEGFQQGSGLSFYHESGHRVIKKKVVVGGEPSQK
jgi:hypothetical protein